MPLLTSPRPRRLGVALTALGLVASAGAIGAAPSSATPAAVPGVVSEAGRVEVPEGDLVYDVVVDDETLTLRMSPVSVRAPGFTVRVQGAGGTFTDVPPAEVPEEHAYLGGVDGLSGASAVAMIDHEGMVRGQIQFESGRTVLFDADTGVVERGAEPTTTFHWPSSVDRRQNRTVSRAMVPRTTYRYDIGYDMDSTMFVRDLESSVPTAVDIIERSTLQLLTSHELDVRLRPAIERIVLRGSAEQSPYVDLDDYEKIDQIPLEWKRHQSSSNHDDLVLLHNDEDTVVGGLGTLYSAGTPDGRCTVGFFGATYELMFILRHELGHTWGPTDNHTNGPEGPTIMSGNAYGRFDGTEVRSMLTHLDDVRANLTAVPASSIALPPYATLDLVDKVTGSGPVTVRPARNDIDANDDQVTVTSVDSQTHLGSALTLEDGTVTLVAASAKRRKPRLDWFSYTITDTTGRTATGVALLRISPRS